MATTSARLFVAIDLPADARAAVVEWRDAAFVGREDVRLVAPEALHVTLLFLGHLPEQKIDPVAALVRNALPAIEPPQLTAVSVKPVPPRRPRLFALDLEDDGARAGRIHAAASGALAHGGLYEPEARPFWPHLTLARVKKGARAGAPAEIPLPAEPWRAEAVTLYRSRLSRAGARYEAVARTLL